MPWQVIGGRGVRSSADDDRDAFAEGDDTIPLYTYPSETDDDPDDGWQYLTFEQAKLKAIEMRGDQAVETVETLEDDQEQTHQRHAEIDTVVIHDDDDCTSSSSPSLPPPSVVAQSPSFYTPPSPPHTPVRNLCTATEKLVVNNHSTLQPLGSPGNPIYVDKQGTNSNVATRRCCSPQCGPNTDSASVVSVIARPSPYLRPARDRDNLCPGHMQRVSH